MEVFEISMPAHNFGLLDGTGLEFSHQPVGTSYCTTLFSKILATLHDSLLL